MLEGTATLVAPPNKWNSRVKINREVYPVEGRQLLRKSRTTIEALQLTSQRRLLNLLSNLFANTSERLLNKLLARVGFRLLAHLLSKLLALTGVRLLANLTN